MPKLSDTMTEGTLVAWKKKKGDKVSAGDVLAEIETDKATMEWESPEDGTLTEIYVEEGGKVNVGDKIAFVGGEGEEAPVEEKKEETKEPSEKEEEKKPEETKAKEKEPKEGEKKEEAKKEPEKKGEPKKEKKEKAVEAGVPPAQPTRLQPQTEEARVKATPVARRVAAELGVDLSSVKGTGPEGRVTETDVRAAAKSKGAAQKVPAPSIKAGESARIQLSGMRKIIAQRLVESLGPVPHFYLNIDIDAGPLMEAREELKSGGEGTDAAKITVNDLVLKAAVQAAVKVPRVNASFDGDTIFQYADVDLGRGAKQIAARNQRSGERPRAPRAQQTDEAGRISGRDIHRLKSRRHGHRQFFRSHQSAPRLHPCDRQDHKNAGNRRWRPNRRRPSHDDHDELRSSCD